MGSRIRIKSEIEEKHLLHKVMSKLRYLKLYFPLNLTNSSPVDKVFNFIKFMNLWTDSERKWALEYESKPKLKNNICFIMLCPIKILITLFPLEIYKLFSCGQSIQFY